MTQEATPHKEKCKECTVLKFRVYKNARKENKMDYKEKYEQALERAKVINPGTADYEVAVKIFPELKESKDEKIRKALIQHINMCNDFEEYMKGE